MRRKEKEITDPSEIESILARNNLCRLALCDGTIPYVIPMHYGYNNGKLYLHSAPEGRKIDCIRKNSNVSFEVTDTTEIVPHQKACGYTTRYRSIIGTGSISIVLGADEKVTGLQTIMQQITGSSAWELPAKELEHVVVLMITVASLTGKQSG